MIGADAQRTPRSVIYEKWIPIFDKISFKNKGLDPAAFPWNRGRLLFPWIRSLFRKKPATFSQRALASRHSALSWEHASRLEAQLKAEVAELLARAEAGDEAEVRDGLSIPEELALREKRLAKLAVARAKIEARAKERYERELAEHEAKLAAREAKTVASGKRSGGRTPAAPVEAPLPNDQINLTDEDSRIVPVTGGGFDQCYNAQAVVARGAFRSLRPMSFRRRTTSMSSNRCWTRSRFWPICRRRPRADSRHTACAAASPQATRNCDA